MDNGKFHLAVIRESLRKAVEQFFDEMRCLTYIFTLGCQTERMELNADLTGDMGKVAQP